jgi:hypothetical protein
MEIGMLNDQAKLSQEPQNGPALLRNDQKWESLREEIHTIYMIQMTPLPKTMLLIEERHGFKAS